MAENAVKPEKKKTSIGGQALIEGVMMRGPYVSAMSVRKPDGEIVTETWSSDSSQWYRKVPVVRGIINFVVMLHDGYKYLMKSADIAGIALDDEEPSKLDKWIDAHMGKAFGVIFNVLVTVVALAISIGLFMLLPAWIVKGLGSLVALAPMCMTICEGVLKIAIFVAYLWLVTRLKDIQRVFQYHGAEHKTIACYEAGDELTPQRAKNYTRFHPRCGTSFMLIVLVISIFVFSVVSWDNIWIRAALKLALLPLVVGISYEIIRFAGRHNNPVTRVISAPGLWLQRLTTFEPDESQLEVAIASMKPCIPENEKDDEY